MCFFRIWFRSSDRAEFFRALLWDNLDNNIRAPDYRVVGDAQTATYASDQINRSSVTYPSISEQLFPKYTATTKYSQ